MIKKLSIVSSIKCHAMNTHPFEHADRLLRILCGCGYRQLADKSILQNSRWSVAGLRCRNTLSVGWRGEVYDCDFDQQLGMQRKESRPLYVWDIHPEPLEGRFRRSRRSMLRLHRGTRLVLWWSAGVKKRCSPTVSRMLVLQTAMRVVVDGI